MRQAGKIAAATLKEIEKHIKIGVGTRDLEHIAEKVFEGSGAEASFKKVEGYQYCICATPNDWVVHGLPGDYKLKDGDLIGIDLGAY